MTILALANHSCPSLHRCPVTQVSPVSCAIASGTTRRASCRSASSKWTDAHRSSRTASAALSDINAVSYHHGIVRDMVKQMFCCRCAVGALDL